VMKRSVFYSSLLVLEVVLFVYAFRHICRTGGLFNEEKYAPFVDMKGKTVIVSGTTGGIGFHIAHDIAKMGAKVIIACRNPDKARANLQKLKDLSGNNDIHFLYMDLSSKAVMNQFKDEFVKKFGTFDVLINNAATLTDNNNDTSDGFAEIVGTNHLGTKYLTYLLLPYINKETGRIVIFSSLIHHLATLDLDDIQANKSRGSLSSMTAYGVSKLNDLLFTLELDERLAKEGSKVTANTLSPGMSVTNMIPALFQNQFMRVLYSLFMGPIFKEPRHAAQISIYLATSPELKGVRGKYFTQVGEVETPHPQVADITVRKKLWEKSCKLLGIPEDFVSKALKHKTK